MIADPEISAQTQITITAINGVLNLLGVCFTAWIGLQLAKVKQGVELNGVVTTQVQKAMETADEKLNANTAMTREAKHAVANVAQTQSLVKKQLDIDREITQKKLEEIVDVATTTQKVATTTQKVAAITQKLVNGEKLILLQDKATALRLLADATQDPEQLANAEQAERIANAHAAQVREAEERALLHEDTKNI